MFGKSASERFFDHAGASARVVAVLRAIETGMVGAFVVRCRGEIVSLPESDDDERTRTIYTRVYMYICIHMYR